MFLWRRDGRRRAGGGEAAASCAPYWTQEVLKTRMKKRTSGRVMRRPGPRILLAPITGKLVSQLALEGRTDPLLEAFRPERFAA
jgi:hypothetical protein